MSDSTAILFLSTRFSSSLGGLRQDSVQAPEKATMELATTSQNAIDGLELTPTPFETEHPEAAQYLMQLYLNKPQHVIILENPLRLHMCYFPREQINVT